MPRLPSSYKGPAVVMSVGAGFALVGSLPVGITLGTGAKSSATIIGMGFIGFGLLVLVPGVCWCFVVQHRTYKSWLRKRRMRRGNCEGELEALPPDNTGTVELDSVLISEKTSCSSYGGTTRNFRTKTETASMKSFTSHQSQELLAVSDHDDS